MLKLLSNNLFLALNSKNIKLMNYLFDEDCLLLNAGKTILGKQKIIDYLISLIESHQVSEFNLINQVQDAPDTLLISYKIVLSAQETFGSLVLRITNKKISYLKNFIINE